MWSLASIQRPSTLFALPRYTILHIFAITAVSEQPKAQRPAVQALSSSKSQTYVRVTSAHRERVFYVSQSQFGVSGSYFSDEKLILAGWEGCSQHR